MEQRKVIRVGSRKSELALIQTKHTISLLQKQNPHLRFEIHKMSTMGDRVLNISLPKIGEKSLFTKDLEESLRNGGVDLVVHSLKDLPTALPLGMAIGAVLEREDPRDALVLRENYNQYTLETLPEGSIIGTSSLRRTAQLRRKYPQLVVCDIRGNLNTRLAKLDAEDSKFSGIILAQAGLVRMGWMSRISQVLEPVDLLYAVGQGALAVECRANDHQILTMLQKLMCLKTTCRILAERSFLKTLGGGCSAPVAVCSQLTASVAAKANDNDNNPGEMLSLVGAVWSLDGSTEIQDQKACLLSMLQQKPLARTKNALSDDDSDASNETPPCKRARSNSSSSPELSLQGSPPVINEDVDIEHLSSTYNVNQLIEKHRDLVKKCPVVSIADAVNNNRNGTTPQGHLGEGDAMVSVGNSAHCPFPVDIGQDFMGECPFVSNETKIHFANSGKCPLTKNDINPTKEPAKISQGAGDGPHCLSPVAFGANDVMGNCPFVNKETKVHMTAVTNKCPITANGNSTDVVDNAVTQPSSSSKCPFNALHNTTANDFQNSNLAHGKCPFLQKVQMFDYSDEKRPTPTTMLPVLIEDVGDLFSGLYRHACYNSELYMKSDRLGRELAQVLIEKGALEVMKLAQAEVHSKS